MKKKLGALVLALSSSVITAACASSNASSRPRTPQPDSGETWVKAEPSVPSRPAHATSIPTVR